MLAPNIQTCNMKLNPRTRTIRGRARRMHRAQFRSSIAIEFEFLIRSLRIQPLHAARAIAIAHASCAELELELEKV